MKIELDTGSPDINIISAYSAGAITIRGARYAQSLVVTANRIIEDWPPGTHAEVRADHIEIIVRLEPEIVLLGTGDRLVFPPVEVLAPLHTAGIGVEVMDTGAACRSYNFLVNEGRRVAAALLPLRGPDVSSR